VVQGLPYQGVALLVPPGSILRTSRHKIKREIRVNAVQDFQGLPKAFAVKSQHHQEVHIGVRSRHPLGIGTKKDDSLRLELASNSLAQVSDLFLVNHLLLPVWFNVRLILAALAISKVMAVASIMPQKQLFSLAQYISGAADHSHIPLAPPTSPLSPLPFASRPQVLGEIIAT
jgi:hypothetical protein